MDRPGGALGNPGHCSFYCPPLVIASVSPFVVARLTKLAEAISVGDSSLRLEQAPQSPEIAMHLSGARNDSPFLSLRGTIVPKQSRRGVRLLRFVCNDKKRMARNDKNLRWLDIACQ
jgi:hypothetical protein